MEDLDIATIFTLMAEGKIRFVSIEDSYWRVSATKLTKKQFDKELKQFQLEKEKTEHGH